jgi:TIR domain
MPKILLNYRRDDSAPYAGRIADRLRNEFGPDRVFVDIDAIRPGEDFVDAIDRSVASCDVLVALIGKTWLSSTDDAGNRRLDRADDYVRMEIGKALERRVRVIPTLVGGAVMPEGKDLPQDIAALSRRQGIEISDSRFHQDVDRLIGALSGAPVDPPPQGHPAHPPSVGSTGTRLSPFAWLIGVVFATLMALAAYQTFGPGIGTRPHRDAMGRDSTQATDAQAASERDAAPAAAGVVGPQGDVGRPAPSTDAPGKTGVKVVWRGANSVPCYLYDAAGEKALSPESVVWAWHCEKNGPTWDAGPGRYQLKIGGVANTIAPIPLTVTAGRL